MAQTYDELAAAEPDRFVVLDATQPPDTVLAAALKALTMNRALALLAAVFANPARGRAAARRAARAAGTSSPRRSAPR